MKRFTKWMFNHLNGSISKIEWDNKDVWVTTEPLIYTPHKLIPVVKKRKTKPKWMFQSPN